MCAVSKKSKCRLQDLIANKLVTTQGETMGEDFFLSC